MEEPQDVGGEYWGYLINKDKTAAPLLRQLCLGLTRIMQKDGKGPENQITPERLANFYRSVGGNLDSVFLAPREVPQSPSGYSFNGSLSFIYRTLGCYHSLQPTPNAFETPSLPCLTPDGFVRWQTIQILLNTDEHARYMQKAVEIYDVQKEDGQLFPKFLPRDALPGKPDLAMERWHQRITSQLDQDSRRNSPYVSPAAQPTERSDTYFPSPIPEIRRPAGRSRERPTDGGRGPGPETTRRNSLPESPSLSPHEYNRAPSAYYSDGRRRSASAQRPGYGSRPRSATTGYSSQHRHPSSSSHRDTYERHSPYQQRQPQYARPSSSRRYQSTVEEDTSEAEASSDDSEPGRRYRPHDQSTREKPKKRTLLAPVLDMLPGRRRHSTDISYEKNDRRRREDSASRAPRGPPAEPSRRSQQSVHFRDGIFDNPQSTVSEAPMYDPRDAASGRRSGDPHYAAGYPMARDPSSGSGSDRRSAHDQRSRGSKGSRDRDVPLRVSTVTGVHGRRYANVEASPSPPGPAGPSAGLVHPDGRQRYSLAV